MQTESNLRIGQGFDVHAFAEERPLIIGGVRIDHTKGLAGHSDADVLTHAIADALLGAVGAGDIGVHFPDSDPKWKDADSMDLLAQVAQQIRAKGFGVVNIDATIIAQAPRMGPHMDRMRMRLSDALGVDPARINIKATTTERLGCTGRGEGIAAMAVALVDLMSRD